MLGVETFLLPAASRVLATLNIILDCKHLGPKPTPKLQTEHVNAQDVEGNDNRMYTSYV